MIEFSTQWFVLFWLSFFLMEFNSWFLHKYVMHGFLWHLHKDHHTPRKDCWWELNDFFALFFAVPSFFFILFSSLLNIPLLGAVGFGLMLYGLAYFIVHEVIIHRRIKIKGLNKGRFIRAVKAAHHVHHSKSGKHGTTNFGMLIVPMKYYQFAYVKRVVNSL